MMASMSEQRRFLANIDKVSSLRLNMIAEELMSIIRNNQATSSDIQFHEEVCKEIFKRTKE